MSIPEPTDLDWLALCLVTESNRPDEWPAIAQVIENRRRAGHWGSTYKSVMLAPMQFSAFNWLTASKSGTSPETLGALTWARFARTEHVLLLVSAVRLTQDHLHTMKGSDDGWTVPWDDRISTVTTHYWSPVSMRPVNSKPAWAGSASRIYCPDGIDPNRFQFAEGVS